MSRLGDALQDVLEMTSETLDLGYCTPCQRSRRDDALERLCVLGTYEPYPMTGYELDVVAASTENAGSLIRAPDTSATLVDVQQDVLVVAQVMAVGDGVAELLFG